MGRKELLILIAGFILLLIVPRFLREYHFYVANLVLIYILIGMGLNLLMGITGQVNIGNAAFFGIGGYATVLLMTKLHIPYFLCIPFSGIVAALLGISVAIPASRVRGHYLAMVTFCFLAIFQVAVIHWRSFTNGQTGILMPSVTLLDYRLSNNGHFYYFVAPVVLFFVWLTANVTFSELGEKFMAIRDSEVAAESLGINLLRYKVISFAICSFYAGIAGSLYAPVVGYINPEPFGAKETLDHVSLLIIGGMGTFWGPMIGAILFIILPEIFVPLAGYKVIIFGLVVLIFILFQPKGLQGWFSRIPAIMKNINRKKQPAF